jgi:uncharacterized protein YdiU (UPF0061 family)
MYSSSIAAAAAILLARKSLHQCMAYLLTAFIAAVDSAKRVRSRPVMSAISGATTGLPAFDNAALRKLRVAAEFHGPPRQVAGAHFVRTRPLPLVEPRLVARSDSVLELLQLGHLADADLELFLSGNELMPGSDPAAHCCERARAAGLLAPPAQLRTRPFDRARSCSCARARTHAPHPHASRADFARANAHADCGHQFGAFAGQLGDGAAMYLGEVAGARGRWELQLKGAGPTPFSRTSDGRKVLRSSIREFLGSEAMHGLGIATTRAASCVTSSSRVDRDIRYDGNARPEPCAVVARVARTFVRLGSFEVCRPRDSQTGRAGPSAQGGGEGSGEGGGGVAPLVGELIDYVADAHWLPGVAEAGASGSAARARALLDAVVERTAALAAHWQSVGFTHGVLNTDNLSIVGDTLDYGPYGFMQHFSRLFTPNGSDNAGRYSYGNQPDAVAWDMRSFAQTLALADALPAADAAEAAARFQRLYQAEALARFRRKLALTADGPRAAGGVDSPTAAAVAAVAADADAAAAAAAADDSLVLALFEALEASGADMSGAFLALGHLPRAVHAALAAGATPLSTPAVAAEMERALDRLARVCTTRVRAAALARPSLPERALEQLVAIRASEPSRLGLYGVSDELLDFQLEQLARQRALAALPTDAAKAERDAAAWRAWLRAYVERLALEGADAVSLDAREAAMLSANPHFILREHLLQRAIARAEQGEPGAVVDLLGRARAPYPSAPLDEAGWRELVASLPPDSALDFCLTCSS